MIELHLPRRLLVHDEDTFREEHREARSFLLAASLREECFSLYCIKNKTDWQKDRLKELINCPACQEKWFLNLIGEK